MAPTPEDTVMTFSELARELGRMPNPPVVRSENTLRNWSRAKDGPALKVCMLGGVAHSSVAWVREFVEQRCED